MVIQPQSKKIYYFLILIFLLFSLAVGVAGYFFYDHQKKSFKQEKWEQISAIASLKARQITDWRRDRMEDTNVILDSPFITHHVQQFLENPKATGVRQELLKFMSSLQKSYHYQRIFLIDPAGTVRLSAPEGIEVIEPHAKKIALEAIRQKGVILSDLYRSGTTSLIRLSLLVPLLVPQGRDVLPVGIFLLRIDPYQFLYPLLQLWPTPSLSSESLLVRREGDDVLFLNDLIHKKDTALNFRLSISEQRLPAVMAVMGKEGIVEGVDYRGVPVLAALRKILDSPWFLVAKVDQEEIYTPIRVRARFIASLVGILVFGAALGVVFLWKGQRVEFQRRQYEAELERRALTEHFDYLTRYANDIILLMDKDLKILDANERAMESYGYSRDELLQRSLKDLRAPEARPLLDDQMKKVKEQNGFVMETLHQRKDGTMFPVENSSRAIEVEGKFFYQSIIRDVTERKRAEEELQASERRYRMLMDSANDAIFIADTETGMIVDANLKALAMIGRSLEEIRQMHQSELHPPEEKERYKAIFRDHVFRTSEITEDLYVVNRDGQRIPVDISASVIEVEGKRFLQGIFRDITEHKKAEEALNWVAKEEAVMAEIGRIISSTLNLEEVYDRFAEEVRRLISFDRIAINIISFENQTIIIAFTAGKGIDDRRRGDVIPLQGSVNEAIMCTKASLLIQTENENELERDFPSLLSTYRAGFRSMISVPLVSRGVVIGALHLRSLQSNAYTERDLRLAERVGIQISGAIANALLFAERERAGKELRENEERFRELFDDAPVGYHEFDKEGRITHINRTELEMLGFTLEEIVGQPLWSFIIEEEVSQKAALAKLSGAAPPGKAFERTYRRKDGTTVPVLIEDKILKDREGNVIGIRSTMVDITDRKRAEQEMATLQEQLRQSQKMEAVGQLAGGIAHDFNNLLTIIKGYSQLSLGELKEEDPLEENIKEIHKATDRASDLVRKLLAFSRRQVMEMKVLDINILLKDLDRMLRRLIGEDIELVTLLADDLGRVKTDPGQMEQVILNLAVNARDAMPSGGKLTVETSNVELDVEYSRQHVGVNPGRYVMLSISDTGMGMKPEVKERIFEPFFTTKERGKGTGLGLSTVYGIVNQSGGNIWVYSEPGQGTNFKIYLPRVDEPLGVTKAKRVNEELPCGSETILVVEDEEEVRKLAVRLLRRQGYRVLEAAPGGEAFLICERHQGPIHLLVTDVVMPKMSGRELAGRLASIHPEMRVLYMSGYTDNTIVHHGILEKDVNFIQKPFTPDILARKVREVLDQ